MTRSVAAHGPQRSSGMLVVCQGSGELPTLILRLPLGPNSVVGDGGRPPRGDFGGLLAAEHFVAKLSHTLVPLDPEERGRIQGSYPVR